MLARAGTAAGVDAQGCRGRVHPLVDYFKHRAWPRESSKATSVRRCGDSSGRSQVSATRERFSRSQGLRVLDSLTVPAELPAWLTEADLQTYIEAFRGSGFRGGLNWYRNANRNWESSADLAEAKVQQPAMFVTGSRDPARNPAAIERLREVVPNLRMSEVLEACGHWTQQERPEDVTRLLLEFLRSLGPDSRTM